MVIISTSSSRLTRNRGEKLMRFNFSKLIWRFHHQNRFERHNWLRLWFRSKLYKTIPCAAIKTWLHLLLMCDLLYGIQKRDMLTTLSCHHLYHSKCITQKLKKRPNKRQTETSRGYKVENYRKKVEEIFQDRFKDDPVLAMYVIAVLTVGHLKQTPRW
ncbi:hypothetical protein MKW98_028545 [Papaver atlanticum]|uniref:Uncharacterized protein n=1 Tax=Papaver atlanticum TaxID=357466 RepID=A0AAD4TD31_9MAGN|nr:hypothetical protein MKW98_028545 [Papaver atlanticum]